MSVHHTGRWAWVALLPGVMLMTSAMAAETPVKFTLDFKFEGPSAPFLLALDKGYYRAEGLDVTVDASVGALEPIERVASGAYDMGLADINSLIKSVMQSLRRQSKWCSCFITAGIRGNRPQKPRHQRPQGSGKQNIGRTINRRRFRAMADFRARKRYRYLQGKN